MQRITSLLFLQPIRLYHRFFFFFFIGMSVLLLCLTRKTTTATSTTSRKLLLMTTTRRFLLTNNNNNNNKHNNNNHHHHQNHQKQVVVPAFLHSNPKIHLRKISKHSTYPSFSSPSLFVTCARSSSSRNKNKNIHRNMNRNSLDPLDPSVGQQQQQPVVVEIQMIRNDRLYGIPNSNWKQKKLWNWGSASGTGHDCALLCRQKLSTKVQRKQYIDTLLSCRGTSSTVSSSTTTSAGQIVVIQIEEIILVLALAWQRGRWDGSDGGPNGGYSEVLNRLVQAERYSMDSNNNKSDDDDQGMKLLIHDMMERYSKLQPNQQQKQSMEQITNDSIQYHGNNDNNIYDINNSIFCRCSGLILQTMGFIEKGL